MQKKLKWLFLFTALFTTTSMPALYQSNPFTPQLLEDGFFLSKDCFMGIKAGFQYDQVFNRRLKAVSGVHGAIGECKILADQGVVTLNFFDRVELFGSIGGASFHVVETIKPPGVLLEYQTHNNLIWGAGGRITLYTWGNTTLCGGAGYEQCHADMRYITLDGVLIMHSPQLHYNEWQIGFGIAHKIDIFIPYIGATYSRVKASLRGLSKFLIPAEIKMRNKENFGLTVGCDLTTGKIIDLGIEFRMFSEQAITVKGDIKF